MEKIENLLADFAHWIFDSEMFLGELSEKYISVTSETLPTFRSIEEMANYWYEKVRVHPEIDNGETPFEPLQILTNKYKSYVRAKEKSVESYEKGSISKELHDTHVKNLDVLLKDYENAIEILTKLLTIKHKLV